MIAARRTPHWITYLGLENIPAQGRVLIVPNHSGQLPMDGVMIGYALATNPNGPRAAPWYTPEDFKKIVMELDKRGYQIMTHAIGDAAACPAGRSTRTACPCHRDPGGRRAIAPRCGDGWRAGR